MMNFLFWYSRLLIFRYLVIHFIDDVFHSRVVFLSFILFFAPQMKCIAVSSKSTLEETLSQQLALSSTQVVSLVDRVIANFSQTRITELDALVRLIQHHHQQKQQVSNGSSPEMINAITAGNSINIINTIVL